MEIFSNPGKKITFYGDFILAKNRIKQPKMFKLQLKLKILSKNLRYNEGEEGEGENPWSNIEYFSLAIILKNNPKNEHLVKFEKSRKFFLIMLSR